MYKVIGAALLIAAIAAPLFAQTTTPPSPTTPQATTAPTTQGATEFRSSKLVGSNVYNAANENIGEVDDIVLDTKGAVSTVVLSVGGFLGMGERYVAVPFSTLKTAREGNGNLRLTMDATKESLKSMPAYTYQKS